MGPLLINTLNHKAALKIQKVEKVKIVNGEIKRTFVFQDSTGCEYKQTPKGFQKKTQKLQTCILYEKIAFFIYVFFVACVVAIAFETIHCTFQSKIALKILLLFLALIMLWFFPYFTPLCMYLFIYVLIYF